jgi:hypothetical protein
MLKNFILGFTQHSKCMLRVSRYPQSCKKYLVNLSILAPPYIVSEAYPTSPKQSTQILNYWLYSFNVSGVVKNRNTPKN